MMETTQKYFFAGASAALAMVFFVWHIGFVEGSARDGIASTQPPLTNGYRGTITSINGTTITLKSSTPQDTSTHQLFTDFATIFDQIIPKDPFVYQGELSAFKAKAKQASTTPPLPYSLKKVSLTDLRSGNSIIVLGNTVAGRFTASRIIIEPPLISPTKP